MKHKVVCASCGKVDHVMIDEISKITPKEWWYFGRLNINSLKTDKYFYRWEASQPSEKWEKIPNEKYDPKAKKVMAEYWECPNCHNNPKTL